MKKIVVLLGTRPEVIKLAPVIKALKTKKRMFKTYVVATGQHREMANRFLSAFGVYVDENLNIMKENQTLTEITSRILAKFEADICDKFNPDLIIVQGDTTTAYTAALAAFYKKIKVAHVEAGLRTEDKFNPFPEEMNRRMISCISDFNFAPTRIAAQNLADEGHSKKGIFITGNTIVDALKFYSKKVNSEKTQKAGRLIMVTMHRRENFGRPAENVCKALLKIRDACKDVRIRFPVHPNPNIKKVVAKYLTGKSGIILSGPVSYDEMIEMIREAHLILTDSGGIQEEAPTFGKPVLVLRKNTERPEGIAAGVAKLVGTDTAKIFRETKKLLDSKKNYKMMSKAKNPYGDGKASERIVKVLEKHL